MFNAAFTVKADADMTVKMLKVILIEKGFHVEGPGKDPKDTIHLKAVNKPILSMFKHLFKTGSDMDPQAQRIGIHAAVVQGDENESHLFFSVHPKMEFFHFPEIPGISDSKEERKTDEMLCESILEGLCTSILEHLPEPTENFRTLPMKKQYSLPDTRDYSRAAVEKTIVDILKELKFEVIKRHQYKYNTIVEIRALNMSTFHALVEHIKNRGFSRYLEKAQRIAVRFTIIKPELGLDHKMEIHVTLYPSMEFINIEEIHGFSQEVDEELTDSLMCQEIWDSLVSMLDEKFAY